MCHEYVESAACTKSRHPTEGTISYLASYSLFLRFIVDDFPIQYQCYPLLAPFKNSVEAVATREACPLSAQ